MKNHKNDGFAVVEGFLILLILALIGFVGYTVYKDRNNVNKLNDQSASQNVSVPKSSTTTAPASVSNATDLNQASSSLNADNPSDNGSDLNTLNSQSSAF